MFLIVMIIIIRRVLHVPIYAIRTILFLSVVMVVALAFHTNFKTLTFS